MGGGGGGGDSILSIKAFPKNKILQNSPLATPAPMYTIYSIHYTKYITVTLLNNIISTINIIYSFQAFSRSKGVQKGKKPAYYSNRPHTPQ